MPEHLKALVVVLFLALAVFALARAPACASALGEAEFARRRNLWLGLTLAVFLAHNFWVFFVVAAALLRVAAWREKNIPALAAFVLLAVPPINDRIGGFGLINYFFDVDYLRLLSLALLLPAFLRVVKQRSLAHFASEPADRLLLAYLLLNLCLVFPGSSVTGTLRSGLLAFLDVFLPYTVASRLTRDPGLQKSAIASYVVGAAVLAAIGLFEISKHWLLYNSLSGVFGLSFGGEYLLRDGELRATGTSGQAIPFGFAMAVGFCLLLGLRRSIPSGFAWLAGLALLAAGMLASYSRGPWVGAAAGILVFALTGPRALRNLLRFALAGSVLGLVALITPIGDRLLFGVTVEDGSVSYRQRVLDASISQVLDHPWFGNLEFAYAPEIQDLRQGQGIIDIVNTYAGIGLSSGLVGLFLFMGFFGAVLWALWRRMKLAGATDGESRDLGRSLLAALACILVTIGTVSSISAIPFTCYLIGGLALAYARTTVPAPAAESRGTGSTARATARSNGLQGALP